MSQGEAKGFFVENLVELPGRYLVKDTGIKLVELPLCFGGGFGIIGAEGFTDSERANPVEFYEGKGKTSDCCKQRR